MRLFGRMSIYGEYLTSIAPALTVMSRLHLATNEHSEISLCKSYDPSRDTVAALLRRRNFATRSKMRGNLPLGYGFAGSTILALLHLHDQLCVETILKIAGECDEVVHGFHPSGLDSMACLHQRSGLFYRGQWTNVDVPQFEYTTVVFPKVVSRPLSEIKAIVGSNVGVLGSLADRLSSRLVGVSDLDYELLLEYCRVLATLGVYSSPACAIVKACLENKIVAKGIGGLHEKALLVIWPRNVLEAKDLVKTLHSYGPTSVFSGISV